MVRSTVSHWSLASTGAIWFPEVHQYAFCGISGLDYLMYTYIWTLSRVLPRKNPQSDTRFDKVCHIAELSCHVQKWQDISWLDVPSKKEAKKRGEKRRGKNDGGK